MVKTKEFFKQFTLVMQFMDQGDYIIKPINEEKRQYKVELHSHTNCSDGAYSPEELKALYQQNGFDAEGEFVTDILKAGGVSTTGLAIMHGEKTTFTEVMSVPGGQRTFFVYPGAGADFGIADMDYDNISAKILHLGYFLLLQKVDDGDGLKILQKA